MGLRISRCVIAVSVCIHWDDVADVFYVTTVYDGYSGMPAPRYDGVVMTGCLGGPINLRQGVGLAFGAWRGRYRD